MKKFYLLFVMLSVFLFLGSIQGVNAANPIVLGCPLATGFLYGWDAERGIKLAVEEINANGGVNVGGEKRPFSVEVIDPRDLAPGVPINEALLAVEKLILEKKADFIVGGPTRSEAALAAMDILSKYKKVSIVTSGVLTPAYNKRVAESYDKYKYCFRNSSEIVTIGKDIVKAFDQLKKDYKFNKVFIMVQDVEHARKAGSFVGKLLKEKGWEVLEEQVYPTGTTDYAMGLLKAKKSKADVLFIWMDMPESAILLKQWKTMKLEMLPIGFMSAAEQPGFWKATGGNCEYVLVDVVNGANAPSKINDWTTKFTEAYKKKWSLEPEGYGTSSSYMAVYQLKAAIEKANSLDSDKVVTALEEVEIDGVYGKMKFDKSHQIIPSDDPSKGAVGCIFQWQNGQRVTVFPKMGALGAVKLPEWMKSK